MKLLKMIAKHCHSNKNFMSGIFYFGNSSYNEEATFYFVLQNFKCVFATCACRFHYHGIPAAMISMQKKSNAQRFC